MNNFLEKYELEKANIGFILTSILFSIVFFYFNGILVKENIQLQQKNIKLNKIEEENKLLILSTSKKEQSILNYKKDIEATISSYYTKKEADTFLKYINNIIVNSNMKLLNFQKTPIEYIYNSDKSNKIFEIRKFKLKIEGSWDYYLEMKDRISKIKKQLFIPNESIISLKENGIVQVELDLFIYSFYNKNIIKNKKDKNEK